MGLFLAFFAFLLCCCVVWGKCLGFVAAGFLEVLEHFLGAFSFPFFGSFGVLRGLCGLKGLGMFDLVFLGRLGFGKGMFWGGIWVGVLVAFWVRYVWWWLFGVICWGLVYFYHF